MIARRSPPRPSQGEFHLVPRPKRHAEAAAYACATLGRGGSCDYGFVRAPPSRSPGAGPLLHHLAAEAEQRRRPPAGRGRHLAGRLDQRGAFDQPAEILLVQMAAGDRLDGVLQFGERESSGISSNTTGRYFSLPRSRAIAVARMRR